MWLSVASTVCNLWKCPLLGWGSKLLYECKSPNTSFLCLLFPTTNVRNLSPISSNFTFQSRWLQKQFLYSRLTNAYQCQIPMIFEHFPHLSLLPHRFFSHTARQEHTAPVFFLPIQRSFQRFVIKSLIPGLVASNISTFPERLGDVGSKPFCESQVALI